MFSKFVGFFEGQISLAIIGFASMTGGFSLAEMNIRTLWSYSAQLGLFAVAISSFCVASARTYARYFNKPKLLKEDDNSSEDLINVNFKDYNLTQYLVNKHKNRLPAYIQVVQINKESICCQFPKNKKEEAIDAIERYLNDLDEQRERAVLAREKELNRQEHKGSPPPKKDWSFTRFSSVPKGLKRKTRKPSSPSSSLQNEVTKKTAQTKICASQFGFKIGGNPPITPVYLTDGAQRKLNPDIFIRYRESKKIELNDEINARLNPQIEGLLITKKGPGIKVIGNPMDHNISFMRLKFGSHRIGTKLEQEVIFEGKKRRLYRLSKSAGGK